MLKEEADQRLDIDQATERMKKIGGDDDERYPAFEYYILKASEVIETGPSALSLNSDIKNFKEEGKIVVQNVAHENPRFYKSMKTEDLKYGMNKKKCLN